MEWCLGPLLDLIWEMLLQRVKVKEYHVHLRLERLSEERREYALSNSAFHFHLELAGNKFAAWLQSQTHSFA